MFLSDLDKCVDGRTCRCGVVATEAVEIEFEGGGRLWVCHCKKCANELLDRLEENYERELRERKKEQEFCSECGYSKARHAADCSENLNWANDAWAAECAAKAERARDLKEDDLLALARRFVPDLA